MLLQIEHINTNIPSPMVSNLYQIAEGKGGKIFHGGFLVTANLGIDM